MAVVTGRYMVCDNCYGLVQSDPHTMGWDLDGWPEPEPLGLMRYEWSIVPGNLDDEVNFATSPCEGCGTTLAGRRHRVITMEDDSVPYGRARFIASERNVDVGTLTLRFVTGNRVDTRALMRAIHTSRHSL